MTKLPDRIPYDSWMDSQLSVAKFYGGIRYNGAYYECDYDNCRTEVNEAGETRYFPDLVKVEEENDTAEEMFISECKRLRRLTDA